MTPIVGILIAVLAALLAPTRRGVVVSVLVAMIAATAVQTWDLGAGLGSNPPDTIDDPSYWVVQLVIITIVTGLALGLYRLRLRRAARLGHAVARPALSGRSGATVLACSVLAMTGGLVAGALLISRLHTHRGHGAGDIPWTGVLGMVTGLIALAVVAVALTRGSRADRAAGTAARAQ